MHRSTAHPLFFVLAVFLFSCQPDEFEDLQKNFTGQWELVEMRSDWGLEDVTDFSYTETYEFRSDGTFVKTNSELERQLTGTFVHAVPDQGESQADFRMMLTLTFDSDILDEVIGSSERTGTALRRENPSFWILYGCQEQEILWLRGDMSLTNGGWCIVDAGTYVYRR